jgi:hypothetical protein
MIFSLARVFALNKEISEKLWYSISFNLQNDNLIFKVAVFWFLGVFNKTCSVIKVRFWRWIVENVEGNLHGLFQGTIAAFSKRDVEENLKKNSGDVKVLDY